MTDDRYNRPQRGADDWDEPLNENFSDLGVEVANEVATWSDLPATDEVTQSSDGQWPVYRVETDDVFVRVTDTATEIVGGLGSADRPLPEQHVDDMSVASSITDPSGVAHTAELADVADIRTDEELQDVVGALVQAGGNITTTYDDANDTLTVDTSALDEEQVEDAVAALVTAGSGVTVNYDDPNDALSIAVDESGLSFYDGSTLTAPVDNQSVNTDEAIIAKELGLPEYDDVSNAPQTQGRLVYATGDGTSPEGIYKHDGSSYAKIRGGAFSDSDGDNVAELASGLVGVQLGDSEKVQLGADNDAQLYYDGADGRIYLDGSGIQITGSFAGGLGLVMDTELAMNDRLSMRGNILKDIGVGFYNPQDVRNISSPSQGYVSYHDGSGSNTEGPAHYNGSSWVSTVDGTTIS